MLACGWWAIDEDGRAWLFRSLEKKGLIVSEAASAIRESTLPNENILVTYAPPDLWSRQKDSGRTMAEVFMQNELGIVRSDNNRVQGHMLMKEAMSAIPLRDKYVIQQFEERGLKAPQTLPGFMIFENCEKVIADIRDIQADENNPNDCAKDPHKQNCAAA